MSEQNNGEAGEEKGAEFVGAIPPTSRALPPSVHISNEKWFALFLANVADGASKVSALQLRGIPLGSDEYRPAIALLNKAIAALRCEFYEEDVAPQHKEQTKSGSLL